MSKLEVGDLVLVHDQDNPRRFWKVTSVQILITGRDGIVHGATLRVGCKSGSPTILQRPLKLIYPLEIHSDLSTITTTRSQRARKHITVLLQRLNPLDLRERLQLKLDNESSSGVLKISLNTD